MLLKVGDYCFFSDAAYLGIIFVVKESDTFASVGSDAKGRYHISTV